MAGQASGRAGNYSAGPSFQSARLFPGLPMIGGSITADRRGEAIPPVPFPALKRVLFLRLRSLGDSILMTPCLRVLKEHSPHLHLAVLVEIPFKDVFTDSPCVDELITLDRTGNPLAVFRRRLAAVRSIRRRRFDLALNYHGGSTSLWLTRWSGAPYRAGFPHYRGARHYTHLAIEPERFFGGGPLHTVQYQLALLLALGLPCPERIPNPEVFIPPAVTARMAERLREKGLVPGAFVQVHPTATLETKRWPAPAFAALCGMLRERLQQPVLLTCGPGEEPLVREIIARAQFPLPWFSDLSVKELAAVSAHAGAFIGCDSGPAHLAAALGKRVCVVFGSSNPDAWRPWGTEYRLVRLQCACAPCPGYTCRQYVKPRCILDITPESVFAAFCELMH